MISLATIRSSGTAGRVIECNVALRIELDVSCIRLYHNMGNISIRLGGEGGGRPSAAAAACAQSFFQSST
jgi:nanoRNase/pAp phosphatase (c-di-AMP/oligoRNAs hydrolase)